METFCKPVRTRGYEADPSRAIPLAQFMAYFGMLRWEVLLEPHFQLVDYLRNGHFFVIRDQQVELLRRVGIGVDLEIHLWWEFVGRSSVRIVQQAIRHSDEAVVAQGRITCAWLGPERKLTRIPEPHRVAAKAVAGGPHALVETLTDHADDLGAQDLEPGALSYFDPDPIRHAPGDLRLPLLSEVPEGAWHTGLRIRPSDVDVFGHVNATHYVNLLDDVRAQARDDGAYGAEASWAAGRSTRVGIRYDREVLANTDVTIATWAVQERPGAVAFALQLPDDGPPACIGTVVSEGALS